MINKLKDGITPNEHRKLKERIFSEKTHGTEKHVEELSRTFNGGSGAMYVGEFPPFVGGDTVVFKIDGVEYSLVAKDNEGFVYVGNNEAPGESDLYDWCMYCEDSRVFFFTAKTHTLSWIGVIEIVHRLDEKYMPLLTAENGVRYKLTVSVDGTLSAEAITE